jgi:uroporphyrinogen-III synthase
MLREYGVDAVEPRGDMSSEGLLALPSLQSLAGQRVLIVKGEGGRDLLREKLAARGARVEELVAYRRVKPHYASGELGARILSTDCKFILLSSGEGLHNMVSLLDEASLMRVRGVTLIVPGARVAEQAGAAGFSKVRIADNATDEAMVAAVIAAQNESRAEQATRIEAAGGRDD